MKITDTAALRKPPPLGQDLPLLGKDPDDITEILSDQFGEALLQHCYNEFTYLSRFLPSLYIAGHRNQRAIKRPPW